MAADGESVSRGETAFNLANNVSVPQEDKAA
jgi:hypothetical protein